MTFVRAYPPAAPTDGPVCLLPFTGESDLLLAADGTGFLTGESGIAWPDDALYLGQRDGAAVLAFPHTPKADDDQIGGATVGTLRQVLSDFPLEDAALAGYAAQLLRFQRTARFCPVCGAAAAAGELWSKQCPACDYSWYPPVSPAVLLLVHDGGDQVLLAQKPGWGKRYSILAGFVEPGESLEACCVREAMEEANVVVAEPQYIGSQPWPFPHQLMVSFFARHISGEIRPDEEELSDARWFHVDELPELPPPFSLSRQTIDRWVASRRP